MRISTARMTTGRSLPKPPVKPVPARRSSTPEALDSELTGFLSQEETDDDHDDSDDDSSSSDSAVGGKRKGKEVAKTLGASKKKKVVETSEEEDETLVLPCNIMILH